MTIDLNLDESFFNAVIIALFIGIVVIGVLAGLKITGIFDPLAGPGTGIGDGTDPLPGMDPQPTGPVAGQMNYSWNYHGWDMTLDLYIENSTYQAFTHRPHPSISSTNPEDLMGTARYVVTDGDDGVIDTIADLFLDKSRERGWGDYETISNVLAFVENLTYSTDKKGLRYPVETLVEGEGDSTDHAVLAAAVLHEMGYAVSLLSYPPTYDRRTLIPGATALGIVCDDSVPGRRYGVDATAPVGTFVYHPTNGRVTVDPLPAACPREGGWYAGDAVWCAGENFTGSLGQARYYPANKTFVTAQIPDAAAEFREKSGEEITYVIEDAVWTVPLTVCAAWTVETEEVGTPRGAYDGMVPVFIGGDDLWYGQVLTRDAGITDDLTAAKRMPLGEDPPFTTDEGLTDLLRIPTPDRAGAAPADGWPERAEDYYSSRWVPSGVAWTHDGDWTLFDHALTVGEDGDLYDPWGRAHLTSPAAWRISYEIIEKDEEAQKKMTPYSDVRFAVYRIDEEDGTAELERTFGWQSRWGGENENQEAVFGPGTYEIAVFVRNCNVEVEIEYHQKAEREPYGGWI